MTMSNTPDGGKKKSIYHDDLWNIKYLTEFRWTHLSEKVVKMDDLQDRKCGDNSTLESNFPSQPMNKLCDNRK